MNSNTARGLVTGLLITAAAWPAFSAPEQQNNQEPRFLAKIRQLTYEGRRCGEGYFSGDGKSFIFQGEREPENPFDQIYILNLETGETHRVSPGTGRTTCGFFRPGTDEVLFASSHLDPEAVDKQKAEFEFRASGKQRRYEWAYDEHYEIFSARRDGSNVNRLTSAPGYDAEASYSPDGNKIVFCSLRDAYPADRLPPEDRKRFEIDPSYFAEIYVMNADGSDPKRLTEWPGYDGGPFFSSDGTRILWRHFDESGALADVFTMRVDGSDRRRLTDFGSMSWAPFYHPSGEYIIFTSNKLGFSNFELYLVDAAGEKEPVRITYTDGFDGLPVFSPNGRLLAWTSNRTSDGNSQIFLAEWNHGAAVEALKAAPARKGPAPTPSSGGSESSEFKASDNSPYGGREKGRGETDFAPEITSSDLRRLVEYLASDALEGRMTGSRGTRRAADYIIKYFKKIGLQPMGDGSGYTQSFPFTSGVKIARGRNHLRLIQEESPGQTKSFAAEEDFLPLAFTANGEVEGDVVFAGYGLTVPGGEGEGYDSYADLDVSDKIVLVLRYVPEDVDVKRRQELNHYGGLRYKAMVARENGAKGLLVVTGPNSPNAGELIPLAFDNSSSNSGIVVASISADVAEALFAKSGKDLKTIQSGLDIENPHVESGFDLTGVRVVLAAGVEREQKKDRNVIGFLPPAAPSPDAEYVLVGAHYDHIGRGEIGSLARKGEEGQIHNGADDNASGTAAVLELAAAMAAQRAKTPEVFRRGVIFALWSGEEMGIIGSSYFAEHPPVPLEKVAAYINFDMVGRLRENSLIIQGVASSVMWKRLIEKNNVPAGFGLVIQEDPYLPTDVTAFYPKGIPVLSFFTGSHEDYNRPTDDSVTLDYEGLEKIAVFAGGVIRDVAKGEDRPDYVKVERKRGQGGERASLRTYLGTIPDYATEGVEGVKLSGVRAGGPADKAGMRGGDVIVELAGQKITNIYDYTFALDAVKIGEPVRIVVLRDGERVSLTVVPEGRK